MAASTHGHAEEISFDADKIFGDLYQDENLFREKLWSLKSLINPRQSYHDWANQLRFIAPVEQNEAGDTTIACSKDVKNGKEIVEHDSTLRDSSKDNCQCAKWLSFRGHVDDKLLQITPAASRLNCGHYVAVSWCWKATDPSIVHQIEGQANKQCKTPKNIMFRAMRFAASKNQRLIWIDKDCIDQENRDDQEAGIQSMDVVYQRSKWPVGLLNCCFNQDHMYVWNCLVEQKDIDVEKMEHLLAVLRMLDEEQWFSRTWILQESISAGEDMTLLAQHESGAKKSQLLGTIDGELEITIQKLYACLMWAYNCVQAHGDNLSAEIGDEIQNLIFKIWAFYPSYILDESRDEGLVETVTRVTIANNEPNFRRTYNAAGALRYMGSRKNTRTADRLAILANLCQYPIRFHTADIVIHNKNGHGFGFSICAFALALFNGDLSLSLPAGAEHSAKRDHIGYCWGPRKDSSLHQLDYYEEREGVVRINASQLSKDGLCVSGWLWEMDAETRVNVQTEVAFISEDQRYKPSAAVAALQSLYKSLNSQGLSDLAYVFEDLDHQANSPTNDEIGNPRDHLVVTTSDEEIDYERKLRDLRNATWKDVEKGSSSWIWVLLQALIHRYIQAARLNVHMANNKDLNKNVNNAGYYRPETTRVSTINPSAVFDTRGLNWTSESWIDNHSKLYIFTPATMLDTKIARVEHRGDPISWILEPPHPSSGFDVGTETGLRVLRGVQTCRGYWKIPEGMEPQNFVLL